MAAFPDVCRVPGSGPVPMPYPNVGIAQISKTQVTAQKVGLGMLSSKLGPLPTTPAQLKAKLASLHGQLSALPGGNPNQWHTLVDDYVMTVAALYIALSDR